MRMVCFQITEKDERKAEEITLAGVIEGKLARGEYSDMVYLDPVRITYEEPHGSTSPAE